jgi:hypothetical protein
MVVRLRIDVCAIVYLFRGLRCALDLFKGKHPIELLLVFRGLRTCLDKASGHGLVLSHEEDYKDPQKAYM